MPLGEPHNDRPWRIARVMSNFAVTLRFTADFRRLEKVQATTCGSSLEPRYETSMIHEYVYRIVSQQLRRAGHRLATQARLFRQRRTCTVGTGKVFIDRSADRLCRCGWVLLFDSVLTPTHAVLSAASSVIGTAGAAVTRPRWKRRTVFDSRNSECAVGGVCRRACHSFAQASATLLAFDFRYASCREVELKWPRSS